MLVNVAYFADI